MNLDALKIELRNEMRRLAAVLTALEGMDTPPSLAPATVQVQVSPPARGHRRLSPATRKKISMKMKSNWSRGRRRTISLEVKNRIATSQKKRWAKIRIAQVAAAQTAVVEALPAISRVVYHDGDGSANHTA